MPGLEEVVREEHHRILELVATLERPLDEAAFDAAGRRALLDRIVAVTTRHETAERLVVWPMVERRLPGGRGRRLADAGREQETDAQYLLDTLRYTNDDEDWIRWAGELALLTRRHVEFEEQEVWPLLSAHMTALGRAIGAREFHLAGKVAPTRLHPHGPVRRPGLATVGTMVAVGDRVRDRLRGRHPYGAPGSSRDSAGPRDAVAFLEAEYERLRRSLAEARMGQTGPVGVRPGPPGFRGTWRTGGSRHHEVAVIRAWAAHDWMEREHLYPLLRVRLDDGNDLYHHWTARHGEISAQLAVLDGYPHQDVHRAQMLEEATAMITAHLDEAETSVLPRLRAHLTDGELRDLGVALAESRRKAPSRPHAHLAGGGRGARLSRAVLAPVDRIRDMADRR